MQFIWVPLRLVKDCETTPRPSTSVVVVPPAVIASYGSPGPNAAAGPLTSWFRTSQVLPSGPGNAAMPSCRPGSVVPSVRTTGGPSLSWNERYWKPSGRCNRTFPSRKSATGPRSLNPDAACAEPATTSANGHRAVPPAAIATRCRNPRRSTVLVAMSPPFGRLLSAARTLASAEPPSRHDLPSDTNRYRGT